MMNSNSSGAREIYIVATIYDGQSDELVGYVLFDYLSYRIYAIKKYDLLNLFRKGVLSNTDFYNASYSKTSSGSYIRGSYYSLKQLAKLDINGMPLNVYDNWIVLKRLKDGDYVVAIIENVTNKNFMHEGSVSVSIGQYRYGLYTNIVKQNTLVVKCVNYNGSDVQCYIEDEEPEIVNQTIENQNKSNIISKYKIMLHGSEYEYLLHDAYADKLPQYYKLAKATEIISRTSGEFQENKKLELDTSKFANIKMKNQDGTLTDHPFAMLGSVNYDGVNAKSLDDPYFIGLCNLITKCSIPCKLFYNPLFYRRISTQFLHTISIYHSTDGAIIVALFDYNLPIEVYEEKTNMRKCINRLDYNQMKGNCVVCECKVIIILHKDKIQYITVFDDTRDSMLSKFNFIKEFDDEDKVSRQPIGDILAIGDNIEQNNIVSAMLLRNTVIGGLKLPVAEPAVGNRTNPLANQAYRAICEQLINVGNCESFHRTCLYDPISENILVTNSQCNDLDMDTFGIINKVNILGLNQYQLRGLASELFPYGTEKLSSIIYKANIIPFMTGIIYRKPLEELETPNRNIIKAVEYYKKSVRGCAKENRQRVLKHFVTLLSNCGFLGLKETICKEDIENICNENRINSEILKGDLTLSQIVKLFDILAKVDYSEVLKVKSDYNPENKNPPEYLEYGMTTFGRKKGDYKRLIQVFLCVDEFLIDYTHLVMCIDKKTGNFLIIEPRRIIGFDKANKYGQIKPGYSIKGQPFSFDVLGIFEDYYICKMFFKSLTHALSNSKNSMRQAYRSNDFNVEQHLISTQLQCGEVLTEVDLFEHNK